MSTFILIALVALLVFFYVKTAYAMTLASRDIVGSWKKLRSRSLPGTLITSQQRIEYRRGFWFGVILSIFFSGLTLWHYFYLTEQEAQGGVVELWKILGGLYSLFGKWGVVGFDGLLATFSLACSWESWQLLEEDLLANHFGDGEVRDD